MLWPILRQRRAVTLTTSNHDLAAIAEWLEVDTTHHAGGPKGWYSPSRRLISTRSGLTIAEYRSTLSHELGHAYYDDHPITHGWFGRRQERRADEFAAHLLIDPNQLHESASFYGDNLPAIAHDLEVTLRLLTNHLTSLKRREAA